MEGLSVNQMKGIKGDIRYSTPGNENFRILVDGRAMDISSGHLCNRNSNVFYHPVYWGYTKEASERVREMIEKNNPGCTVTAHWQNGN